MKPTPRPQEGDLLPPWKVRPLGDRTPPAWADLKKKFTLLFFYNLGCAGCVGRGLPLAQRIQELYPDLRVIGIHSDFGRHTYPPEDILAEASRQNLTIEQYRDQAHSTYDAYGAEGTPHWVLVSPEGRIHRSFFGSMQGMQIRMDYILRELYPDANE